MSMDRTKAYAWRGDDGKFRMSRFRFGYVSNYLATNIYETQAELIAAASRRGMEIVWEDGGIYDDN